MADSVEISIPMQRRHRQLGGSTTATTAVRGSMRLTLDDDDDDDEEHHPRYRHYQLLLIHPTLLKENYVGRNLRQCPLSTIRQLPFSISHSGKRVMGGTIFLPFSNLSKPNDAS
jgi:hypothetical protein